MAEREEAELQEQMVHLLEQKNMTIATAESCTGGMLAAKITSVPGVSSVYAGGFVTYATEEKHKMLGVPRKILRENGAVSKKTAKLMAAGAARETGTDVAVSITGNAGPEASEGKPVGLVYIGVCIDGKAVGRKYLLEGNRNEIREQACTEAMKLVIGKLTNSGERSKDLKL